MGSNKKWIFQSEESFWGRAEAEVGGGGKRLKKKYIYCTFKISRGVFLSWGGGGLEQFNKLKHSLLFKS